MLWVFSYSFGITCQVATCMLLCLHSQPSPLFFAFFNSLHNRSAAVSQLFNALILPFTIDLSSIIFIPNPSSPFWFSLQCFEVNLIIAFISFHPFFYYFYKSLHLYPLLLILPAILSFPAMEITHFFTLVLISKSTSLYCFKWVPYLLQWRKF